MLCEVMLILAYNVLYHIQEQKNERKQCSTNPKYLYFKDKTRFGNSFKVFVIPKQKKHVCRLY